MDKHRVSFGNLYFANKPERLKLEKGAVSKVLKVPDIELVEMDKMLNISTRFDKLNGQAEVLIQPQKVNQVYNPERVEHILI